MDVLYLLQCIRGYDNRFKPSKNNGLAQIGGDFIKKANVFDEWFKNREGIKEPEKRIEWLKNREVMRYNKKQTHKNKTQINLYKLLLNDINDFFEFSWRLCNSNYRLKFIQTYWEDSIDSITKKPHGNLKFIAFLALSYPIKGLVARTESNEFYIFKEITIINKSKEGKNKGKPNKKLYRRLRLEREHKEKLKQKIRHKHVLKAHKLHDEFLRAGLLSESIDLKIPDEKKIITSQSPPKSETNSYTFWIP